MDLYKMKLLLRGLLVNVFFLMPVLGVAAPSADAIKFWIAHDPGSQAQVSHSAWQELLDRYLDVKNDSGVNRFDYADVSQSDSEKLESYLNYLQKFDPRLLNRQEQLAYWINLYNAVTAKVVLDEYPVDSIREIRFLTSPFGPWDKNLVEVAGEALSLNDIEHGILRPIWQDPRIHFVVNCASIGCPNLAPLAYTTENTERLMEQSAIDFINHTRGVLVGDDLVLSSIFDWYSSDFGANQSEVLSYINKFYNGPKKSVLLENKIKIQYQYDWALNKPD
jgi:hypothetical protein